MPSPSYGAISSSHDNADGSNGRVGSGPIAANNNNNNDSDNYNGHADGGETAGLLGKPNAPSLARRLHRHMHADVSKRWADLVLLVCYLVTGLLDSSSVLIWGSFVSMQTGNSIYLGEGLVRPAEDDRWLRSLISIAAFSAGSFAFARYHRAFASPRKRWALASAASLQLALVIAAAAMVTVGPDPGSSSSSSSLASSLRASKSSGPLTVWIAVPIALVAFQAGGQAVASRVLGFNALTSVVLTSIYCDLASDARVFADLRANPERNRRVAAPVLLVLGAVLGGLWGHSAVGMTGALWTAVGLKAGVVAAWMLWPADGEGEV